MFMFRMVKDEDYPGVKGKMFIAKVKTFKEGQHLTLVFERYTWLKKRFILENVEYVLTT